MQTYVYNKLLKKMLLKKKKKKKKITFGELLSLTILWQKNLILLQMCNEYLFGFIENECQYIRNGFI